MSRCSDAWPTRSTKIRGNGSRRVWLYGIAANRFRMGRRDRNAPEPLPDETPQTGPDAMELIALETEIAKLPERRLSCSSRRRGLTALAAFAKMERAVLAKAKFPTSFEIKAEQSAGTLQVWVVENGQLKELAPSRYPVERHGGTTTVTSSSPPQRRPQLQERRANRRARLG